ncbi:unnamed protein product [Ectocarpus sp. 13 AM-2016]
MNENARVCDRRRLPPRAPRTLPFAQYPSHDVFSSFCLACPLRCRVIVDQLISPALIFRDCACNCSNLFRRNLLSIVVVVSTRPRRLIYYYSPTDRSVLLGAANHRMACGRTEQQRSNVAAACLLVPDSSSSRPRCPWPGYLRALFLPPTSSTTLAPKNSPRSIPAGFVAPVVLSMTRILNRTKPLSYFKVYFPEATSLSLSLSLSPGWR